MVENPSMPDVDHTRPGRDGATRGVPNLSALVPVRRWYCPNCTATDVTREAQPHTRFHDCPGLAGLTAPMLEEGVAAKVEAKVREDYVNGADVQYDAGGRPVMAVETTRDGGTDLAVFAPTAYINGEV